jgi:hypothetical protein
MHDVPRGHADWHGKRVDRARRLVQALHRSGSALISASSELQARDYEDDLGLPRGALAAARNGVVLPPGPPAVSSGPIRSITLVARLSIEKLPHVRAAAELAAAGRARGSAVRLDVHGAGPAEDQVREVLATHLPADAWRLHGTADRPLDVMADADVVVATGRAAVEALVLGRRLVPAKSVPDPAGQLGAPVTPETFDVACEDNFSWRTRTPLDPAVVWDTLERPSPEELEAVTARARREYSAEAMLEHEAGLLAALGPGDPLPLLEACGFLVADFDDDLRSERELHSVHSEALKVAEAERDDARAARSRAEQRFDDLIRTRRYRVGKALAGPLDRLRALRGRGA